MSNEIAFPNDTQRMSIVGATGSGKTHMAVWHLSRRSYDRMPWIVFDFKRDNFINSIEGIQYLEVDDDIPTEPGLYVVQPQPEDDDIAVSDMMRQIWQRGRIGVFVDEGYMIARNNRAFRALLTQGRSKHIPMIILSQRPVWLDRFVFSESEFFHVFRLQAKQDIKKMEEYIPKDLSKRLEPRWSYYYEAESDTLRAMSAAPSREAILTTFRRRLLPLPKVV